MSILIVRAELVNPPSVALCFRHVVTAAKLDYKLDVLLEVEREFTDIYYHYCKPRGLLDCVSQFVSPGEERAEIIIDRTIKRAGTILVERIVPENLPSILNEISSRSRHLRH